MILSLNKYILTIDYVQSTGELCRGIKSASTQGAMAFRGWPGTDRNTDRMADSIADARILLLVTLAPLGALLRAACLMCLLFNIWKVGLSLLLSGLQRHESHKNSFPANTHTDRKVGELISIQFISTEWFIVSWRYLEGKITPFSGLPLAPLDTVAPSGGPGTRPL